MREMLLKLFKYCLPIIFFLGCNKSYDFNGVDLSSVESLIKVDSSYYYNNISISEVKEIRYVKGETITKSIVLFNNLTEDVNFEIKNKNISLLPFKFNELGESIDRNYSLKFILFKNNVDLMSFSKKDKNNLMKVGGPFWVLI